MLDELKEKLKDKFNILRVIMIAAMYIVVTVITAQFSFLDVQLRVTEALCILPVFTPVAVPALFIGCFFANLFAGAPWPDVVFGSLATLIGAYGTWKLRDMKPYIAIIPPIVVNLLVVPFILRFAYGVGTPIPMMMLTVGLGEIGACGVLGLLLYRVLLPYKEKLFGYVDEAEDRYAKAVAKAIAGVGASVRTSTPVGAGASTRASIGARAVAGTCAGTSASSAPIVTPSAMVASRKALALRTLFAEMSAIISRIQT